jgi:hypothetical protein
MRVGDDHGDLDDAVVDGQQPGHLEVDPDQVVFAAGFEQAVGHGGRLGRRQRRDSRPSLHSRPMQARPCPWPSRPPCWPRWPSASGCHAPDAPCGRAPRAGARRLRCHRSVPKRTSAPPTTRSAKGRFGLLSTVAFGHAMLLGWTLLGGLDALNGWLRDTVLPAAGPMAYQLALLTGFTLIGALIELPLEWAATFRMEQRFGFNRMTPTALGGRPGIKGATVGAADRPAAGGADPVDHGRLAAVCGGSGPGAPGSVSTSAARAVPDGDRTAVQQVRAAARRRPGAARAGLDEALRLRRARACS